MVDDTTYARRYAKACDACHKKKIRCDYSEPACQLCRKTGQICRFTRIEKSLPKRPRRGKYLAALEERMKTMESMLQQPKDKTSSPEDASEISAQIDESAGSNILVTEIKGEMYPPASQLQHLRHSLSAFRFPPHDEAMRLAQGYCAAYNHTFPIFSRERVMQRMQNDYPPRKHEDFVWWCAVLVVLTFAHRLRAMSVPALAEEENNQACPFLGQILDAIPKLTYMKPSLEAAQVLLGTAAIMRGTAMPDHVPMLTSTAIRMLQCNNVHLEEDPGTPEWARRTERVHTFVAAYIMDKDIALQFRKPPVLHEQDIDRNASCNLVLQAGVVPSLDACLEANLFMISKDLAMIQGRVWSMIYGGVRAKTREALEAAQEALNPQLAAWKEGLPFRFHRGDLVGKWPKHAIVNIVTLHFRYFHTLVEVNKEPPFEPANPLRGNCPLAKSLPDWPHSTSPLAVEAARDALDLAALTPRGNFQNVWMFFDYSVSAMLTLLVNGIVRPLDEHNAADLQRIDSWLRVVDILATESERPDLLEKKEFILHMRGWTVKAIEDAIDPAGVTHNPEEYACFRRNNAMAEAHAEVVPDPSWWPDLTNFHADIFPLPMVSREVWEPWSLPAQSSVYGPERAVESA